MDHQILARRPDQERKKRICYLVDFFCLGFMAYFVGYLMPNPFLYKQRVLFQTIQFNISIQFNCQKHFYFKLFSLVKQFYFQQFNLA